ncbi:MAG: DUF4827 family protein [Muribaculaceae bacterium]|nr:DUF4827 family protein [Muribaculaceae bacterium]
MKINKTVIAAGLVLAALLPLASCKDNVSYAELLNDERHATNAYLSNFKVINEIPADTVFEVGEDAPFYRIDEEGNVYMQVLRAGDRKNDAPKTSQRIYFRYMRYNLNTWYAYNEWEGDGNEKDMSLGTAYFLYGNFTDTESLAWGYGIQMPLALLGIDCEVNLLIKSQYGLTSEISYVQPFLYHVRYFPSQI